MQGDREGFDLPGKRHPTEARQPDGEAPRVAARVNGLLVWGHNALGRRMSASSVVTSRLSLIYDP